ncbi:hypothetical protein ACJRO7_011167 [Eucalyptus globulus]|uniref:TIR domain-containing protein n=1 Tax=Eucalyptus globulus TaxID=34317 RepID=A0ABD3LEB8_EUCGL
MQQVGILSSFLSIKISMGKGQSLSKIKRKRKRAQKKGAPREKKRRIAEKGITDGAYASWSFPTIPTGGGSDQYDVFLSFRGSDTRKEFTDHLYRSLISVGTVPISVFRDDNSLEIGKDFNSEILNAIRRSKISIPIISENYASSKWCLRELVCIMDCQKSMSHTVLPIFYKVLPSNVRYLNGNFGEAFRSRKKRFDKDIQEGQRALTEVSNLNGWESEKFANGHEGKLVEEVTTTILNKLRGKSQLDVPKHLVGVDNHVNKIRNWLDIPASHARMIGIYGMGGIGKTTLAKVIYNELSNIFVDRSFLPDIRETTNNNGIPYLQNLLIKEILQIENVVCKVDDGINLIKSRFKGKKVLILLDDIDHQNQLDALARERDWFTAGSIIIVTTRYKFVLDQSDFNVDYKYELKELDEVHSLLLFKRHAFRMGHCLEDFEGISNEILSTMGGLPLAIKVIGSYLYGKVDKKVWQDILEKLRIEPDRDVQKTLKISYDALEPTQKEIFLDIACFLIGENSKYAVYMWEDCKFFPYLGIEELKLRCLIKIGDRGEFWMHDQLRDLGRSIFCHGQPPERCLKPWLKDKALRSIREFKHFGSGFDYWPRGCSSTCTSELENLPSSRFLSLCWTTRSEDFNELFPELRWLQWLYIERDVFSSAVNLHLSKLVVLELSQNKLTDDWGGWSSIMVAKQLKVLNLSNSWELRYTPNFSAFTKLEILILSGCEKLKQVDPSIGKLKSLISLDLSSCHNLKELPEEVGELQELKELLLNSISITKIPMSVYFLRKLEKLALGSCCSLVEIPLTNGNLSSLQYLDLNLCSSLRKIPHSMKNFSSLKRLKLFGCKSLAEIPSSIGNLSSLEQLDLSCCQSLTKIPSSIENLSSLEQLNLGSCRFLTEIPSSIENLSSLEQLQLQLCFSLTKIPSSIGNLSSLEQLNLGGCQSLTEIPNSIGNLFSLEQLNLGGCELLTEIPSSIGNFSSLKQLNLSRCQSLTKVPSSIRNLSSLKQLYLVRCKSLTEIPSSIGNLFSLKQLDLVCCASLIEIPNSIGNLSSLEQLNLGNCTSLIEIPNSIGNLSFLKHLYLGGCTSLTEIPSSTGNLSSLEQLDLSYCRSLIEFPNSTGNLSSLEQLNLSYCRSLTEIPSSIGNLFSLKQLDLVCCASLIEIPNSIGNLSSLEQLNLGNCTSLTEIPNSIGNLSFLKHLYLGGCTSLTEIPNSTGNLSSLEQLDLSYCRSLTEIPSSTGNLSSLEQLNLGNCTSLTEIPNSIGNLSFLKHLYLGGCTSLTEIPNSTRNLSSLEQLDLSYCRSLTEIPSSTGNLSSLEQLNLSYCRSLTEIPSSIGNLSSLEQLNLSYCQSLIEIPSSIGNLSSLKRLNLAHCQAKIPSSIGNLSSLK